MVFPPYIPPSKPAAHREYAPISFKSDVEEIQAMEDTHLEEGAVFLEKTMERDVQDLYNLQDSDEVIIIRDSHNVTVQTTDTQVAINLQTSLQLILSLLITISIADSEKADRVTQDLSQHLIVKQKNKQKIIIEKSRDVTITTTDTDISANIQALLQAILAIVARIEAL
jgi:spore coat protein X